VAARVAMYQKDWTGMNTALSESFLDLNGPLTTGPRFLYSTTAGDITNPLWQAKEEANNPLLVQVNFVAEAEAGDSRVFGPSIADGGTAKVRQRTAATAPTGYPSMSYETQLYATNVSPISIIRNEELILMYAEAKIQTNQLPDAIVAINRIRTAHNLLPYAGAVSQSALITEVLKQRRYSLFMEGHRWFDMRRYNLLNTLPNDKPTHSVFPEFPRHKQEQDWDATNPC
ncbi:MAG TPA: RagB/SusD family nutrient uptake outer membrane protein, partial [Chitinophagaceae bacterium]|nr:RagB/SusD family nutrient uptake outer membrane protein [Chitinophagaceae bacterium]